VILFYSFTLKGVPSLKGGTGSLIYPVSAHIPVPGFGCQANSNPYLQKGETDYPAKFVDLNRLIFVGMTFVWFLCNPCTGTC